jgi:hypothetical protein
VPGWLKVLLVIVLVWLVASMIWLVVQLQA